MYNFIKYQYELYLAGGSSISLEEIHRLADKYLKKKKKKEIFGEEE